MANQLALLAAIVSLLCIQTLVNAQDDGRVLVKQLVEKSRRLGYQINPSRANLGSVEDNGIVASVPLTQSQTLNITSEQLEKGQVYLSMQCMKTKRFNGCYRVRATGLVNQGKALGVSLVDAEGKTVASSTMPLSKEPRSPTDKMVSSHLIVIEGPVDVYINGHYIGTFDLVIIY